MNDPAPKPPQYNGSNESWRELNIWAYHNVALWHDSRMMADHHNMTEEDFLRLACSQLLHALHFYQRKAFMGAMYAPMPRLNIPREESP